MRRRSSPLQLLFQSRINGGPECAFAAINAHHAGRGSLHRMNIAGKRVLDFRPGAVFQRTFQGGERPGFAQGAFGNFLSGMIASIV